MLFLQLVANQDEGFPCAFTLSYEKGREQVVRVEDPGRYLAEFWKNLFFEFLIVVGDRGKVRKLKLLFERKVRGRFEHVGHAGSQKSYATRCGLKPIYRQRPIFCAAKRSPTCGNLEPRRALKGRRRSRV